MAHFWNVYQGDKWLAEVITNSPCQAVQEVVLQHGLNSSEGMKAIEFDPDVNDMNVRFVPYGHVALEEQLETEAE
ncbi:hypothetical protein ACEN2T_18145 [Pseudomonas sp. W22_MBD1_FP4]|uniref:hypothetical protein n=1 Tax=Pseudomonas sp. W22_MBD1_FP4 TaxID=3240272 RepID=UPI003F9A6E41